MNRLTAIIFALLPAATLAGPVKDVNVVSMPPVSIDGEIVLNSGGTPLPVTPRLVRKPYLDESSSVGATNNHCETEITAPNGLVIEAVSFRAETGEDTRHFQEDVVVEITTDGVSGEFYFPTEHKKSIWRSAFSPYDPSTRYRNTMSVRLYPDTGSVIRLSLDMVYFDQPVDPATFDFCTLWLSGYLIRGEGSSGLGP